MPKSLYEIEKAALAEIKEAGLPGKWRLYNVEEVERMREDLARLGVAQGRRPVDA